MNNARGYWLVPQDMIAGPLRIHGEPTLTALVLLVRLVDKIIYLV